MLNEEGALKASLPLSPLNSRSVSAYKHYLSSVYGSQVKE